MAERTATTPVPATPRRKPSTQLAFDFTVRVPTQEPRRLSRTAPAAVATAIGTALRRKMPVDFRRYPRTKGGPLPEGAALDAMIAAFSASGGTVTRCPDAHALGSVDLTTDRLLDHVQVNP